MKEATCIKTTIHAHVLSSTAFGRKISWNQSLSSVCFFFFSSRRRHTRFDCDWSSDVCSSDLLQRRLQAMDFVDEEYLLIAQVGQNCGEIPFNLQGRPRGLLKGSAKFIGNDGRQSSLAKPGRSLK